MKRFVSYPRIRMDFTYGFRCCAEECVCCDDCGCSDECASSESESTLLSDILKKYAPDIVSGFLSWLAEQKIEGLDEVVLRRMVRDAYLFHYGIECK